jgi:hypothetical protein
MSKYQLTAFDMPLDASFASLLDTNGKTCMALLAVIDAVNYVSARNAAAGTAVRLVAQGSDTDIGLRLDAKGAGVVTVGNSQVLTTTSAINSDANARVQVALEGQLIGTRRQINFLTGTGVTYTVTDDVGNERVDIEISSSGGGGGVSQQQAMTMQSFGAF